MFGTIIHLSCIKFLATLIFFSRKLQETDKNWVEYSESSRLEESIDKKCQHKRMKNETFRLPLKCRLEKFWKSSQNWLNKPKILHATLVQINRVKINFYSVCDKLSGFTLRHKLGICKWPHSNKVPFNEYVVRINESLTLHDVILIYQLILTIIKRII